MPVHGAQASFDVCGIEVIFAALELTPAAILASNAVLCSSERQRAARFRSESDRRSFIAGRAKLRALLSERLAQPPQAIELVYGPRGKPALAGGTLCFNLSRRGDVAAYAFARESSIGIDIERIQPLPEADRIASRAFSRREYEAYSALPPQEKMRGFFNGWTRKEAFAKAVGKGMFLPLDSFDVSLEPGRPARILRVGETPGEKTGWRLASFSPAPGWVASVAYKNQRRH